MNKHLIASTERLLLRHFKTSDAGPLYRVFGDPEVMRFGDGVQTEEWVQDWLKNSLNSYRTRGFGPYALVEKRSRDLIGYCGLFYFPDINGQPETEVGYRLARSAWGNGYATEAALAVRDHAFHTLGIRRLIAIIDPENIPSIRVAEKIGMRYESDVMLEGYTHPDRVYVVVSSPYRD